MTRRSPLLGSIQPPASQSLQRASPPYPSHGRACPVGCIASDGTYQPGGTTDEPRLTCARQELLGRSRDCKACRSPLDRTLSGLGQWNSRISVRKQRLRSPAQSGSSMDLSWRCASISQLQKAYAGNISGPSSTTRPWRPAPASFSRSSPSAELRCDPLCCGHETSTSSTRSRGLIKQVTSLAASEAHSTQQATSFAESKARFEQQPTTFHLALNSSGPATGSTMSDIYTPMAEIYTPISSSSPSSSSHPAPMTPGSGDISSMFALSHVRGAGDSASTTRGSK